MGEMRPEKRAEVIKDKRSVNEIKISMAKAFRKAIKNISFKKTAMEIRHTRPLKVSRSKKDDPTLMLKKVMKYSNVKRPNKPLEKISIKNPCPRAKMTAQAVP